MADAIYVVTKRGGTGGEHENKGVVNVQLVSA